MLAAAAVVVVTSIITVNDKMTDSPLKVYKINTEA